LLHLFEKAPMITGLVHSCLEFLAQPGQAFESLLIGQILSKVRFHRHPSPLRRIGDSKKYPVQTIEQTTYRKAEHPAGQSTVAASCCTL
jgi:hypothetical protein